MRYIAYLLNLPWTLIGIVNVPFCLPYKASFRKEAVVVHGLCCGLVHLYAPRAKGFAIGNLAVVRKSAKPGILEHELIHVEQHMRYPFIYQFLYFYENLHKGYWNNRFEIEAYDRTDTWPEKKRWY